jgi:hypothetical protein
MSVMLRNPTLPGTSISVPGVEVTWAGRWRRRECTPLALEMVDEVIERSPR